MGAVLTTLFVSIMLFTNSYKKIERAIIAFVSVIGLSFIYELFLVGNRLARCNGGVGDSVIPERQYADYHECAGGGGDAS